MGTVVLSCAVWSVENRGRTLAWQKEEAGGRSGFPSFPHSRHHKAVSLLGQLFHRVSCSPLLCCSTPGRGPSRFHLFKLES